MLLATKTRQTEYEAGALRAMINSSYKIYIETKKTIDINGDGHDGSTRKRLVYQSAEIKKTFDKYLSFLESEITLRGGKNTKTPEEFDIMTDLEKALALAILEYHQYVKDGVFFAAQQGLPNLKCSDLL